MNESHPPASPPSRVLEEFEAHRPRLLLLAVRMLGSPSEADDALQETWMRAVRARPTDVDNIGGWLTTVTSRVCLNMLRARQSRREDPFSHVVADPKVGPTQGPEEGALLADSVSVALLIVLETLDPTERLAFVLHDLFSMPFDEIAPLVQRSPEAARQLASRARRRVRASGPNDTTTRTGEHRRIVDAFFAAAREGNIDGLVALLAPNLTLSSDGGASRPEATSTVQGATAVAAQAVRFAQPGAVVHPVIVNSNVGVLATIGSTRITLMSFTIEEGLIVRIDALADPTRLELLDRSLDQ